MMTNENIDHLSIVLKVINKLKVVKLYISLLSDFVYYILYSYKAF